MCHPSIKFHEPNGGSTSTLEGKEDDRGNMEHTEYISLD